MDKAGIGKANNKDGTKRPIGKGVAKRMKKSNALSGEEKEVIAIGIGTAGRPQKISVSWRVTAIRQTPDEILEKVFRGIQNQPK